MVIPEYRRWSATICNDQIHISIVVQITAGKASTGPICSSKIPRRLAPVIKQTVPCAPQQHIAVSIRLPVLSTVPDYFLPHLKLIFSVKWKT
jgi:hypothetical protein